MVRTQDRFSGNILLYDYLSARRAPLFLNRNLARALRVHQQLSEGSASPAIAGDQPDSRSVWKPPDHDTVDYMMDLAKSNESFVLDVHRIVPIHARAANQTPEQAEHIAKTRVLLRTTSKLQVKIFPTLPGLEDSIVEDQCVILQKKQHTPYNDKTVNISTDRIVVTPELRSVLPEKKYTIYITIKIDTTPDAKELFPYLIPQVETSQIRLTATWSNILNCPANKTLRLQYRQRNLDIGLEVSMYWRQSLADNSIMAAHNRLSRRSRPLGTSRNPPLPNMADQRVKVTFKYGDKTMTEDGFICPHEKDKFQNVDDLRMHFDIKHGNDTLQVIPQGFDRDGVDNWIFLCDVSTHRIQRGEQRPSARADEPFDNHWIAPTVPFNQEQYLKEGNTDFHRMGRSSTSYIEPRAAPAMPTGTRGAQSRSLPDRVLERPSREKKRYPVPAAPPGITFFRSRTRRPLVTGECISESDDDEDDTWIRSRKSAEFEKKANIPTAIKEFLKVFDTHMRSEQLHSDGFAGQALVRFAREKRQWIWREDVTAAFNKKLNELLEDEIISEEVHAECREIVESAGPDMAEDNHEIAERLAQLEVIQTTHDELYDDPPPLRSNTRKPTKGKGKGKAKVTDTGHLTPLTADSDGDLEMREATLGTEADSVSTAEQTVSPLPYDLCLCSEDAQASYRKSPIIACTSMHCIRRTFHYDCIKERWRITQDFRALRKSAWVCEDCKPQSTTGT